MAYTYTNQRELRKAFREQHPDLSFRKLGYGMSKKDYPADTRITFVDWIDHLQRNGDISEALANRATL
jgi:hypothetical protein